MGWSPNQVSLWGLVRPCILYMCIFHHFDLRHCMCTSCETSTLYLILTWGFVCVCHVKPTHFTSFWLEVLYVCNVKPTHFTSFWLEVLRVSCKTHFTSFWLEVLYVCHECEISTLYIILIWGFVCVSWMWNQHTLHHFDLRLCMCVCHVKPAHTLSNDLTEKQ